MYIYFYYIYSHNNYLNTIFLLLIEETVQGTNRDIPNEESNNDAKYVW